MKIIFLDFDGVVTARNGTPGSYMTHGQDEYGATPQCMKRLLGLVRRSGAKIVVSSNWRKFAAAGPGSAWRHPLYGEVGNPLPKFVPRLGGAYLETLPPIRLRKAAVTEWWLIGKPNVESFVALDDMCELEGYDRLDVFRNRYVNTDPETGLTDEDCEKAFEMLSRPFNRRDAAWFSA